MRHLVPDGAGQADPGVCLLMAGGQVRAWRPVEVGHRVQQRLPPHVHAVDQRQRSHEHRPTLGTEPGSDPDLAGLTHPLDAEGEGGIAHPRDLGAQLLEGFELEPVPLVDPEDAAADRPFVLRLRDPQQPEPGGDGEEGGDEELVPDAH
jgi:hypothetical protein